MGPRLEVFWGFHPGRCDDVGCYSVKANLGAKSRRTGTIRPLAWVQIRCTSVPRKHGRGKESWSGLSISSSTTRVAFWRRCKQYPSSWDVGKGKLAALEWFQAMDLSAVGVIMTKRGAESLTGVEDHIAPMKEAGMRTMQVHLNTAHVYGECPCWRRAGSRLVRSKDMNWAGKLISAMAMALMAEALSYHGAHETHEQQAPLPEILIRSCKADQSPITEESSAWRARTSWDGTGSPIVFHSSIYTDQTLLSSSALESLFLHLLLRGRSGTLLLQSHHNIFSQTTLIRRASAPAERPTDCATRPKYFDLWICPCTCAHGAPDSTR